MVRPLLAVLLGIWIPSIAVSKPARDLHAQYVIDRAHAEKVASMQGAYIDPCDPPGKERRWWKPLPDRALDDARAELERYRNVLSCKSIKVDHVPAADLENDWHKAMKRNDAAEARRFAQRLTASALSVRIDRAFVQRRLREMAHFRTTPRSRRPRARRSPPSSRTPTASSPPVASARPT